ncbi:MAG: serine/threonine protein kinase [Sandaracinus sp.]|nr:serine/threonine protein kinase [Sandaracinus sp.]|tara:strand:- start:210 stop:1403 length:1194 start_codon:yes stop_codon:yes gene_type:complete
MRRTRRLGRYHLVHRVAFGGMAEVFRGFTFSADGQRHDVAVKKLLPHFVEDEQFVTMLTDEYRLVSRLRHPNVARFFEIARVGKDVLISMEYVDGQDLRSTIDQARTMGIGLVWEDIAFVLARSLDGLHHAHEATGDAGERLEVVHRDLSPSNILIGYDGDVKVIDFGIAKANLNRIQTKQGVIKGKVKYMSPEQAFGHPLDRRSDVFSAGSVLYELCTGRQPFRARTEVELIFAVRDAAPPDCRQLVPDLPEPLARIVDRSMARERRDRFQTAAEMRDALVDFLQSHAPGYRRTRLARFMKHVWAEEIEADLRALEDFVLDLPEGPAENLGTNLLADELGPDAAYARFSPMPTRVTRAADVEAAAVQAHAPLAPGETVMDPFAPATVRVRRRDDDD